MQSRQHLDDAMKTSQKIKKRFEYYLRASTRRLSDFYHRDSIVTPLAYSTDTELLYVLQFLPRIVIALNVR